MTKIEVGDWAVFRSRGFAGRIVYAAAEVEKVTAKLIYADAHYKRQHSPEDVIRMPSEADAKLFAERAKSAYAEASRRAMEAWASYDIKVTKLEASARGDTE